MNAASGTCDPTQDPRAFRDALGAFVTGVTVVETQTDAGPVAIVANSFASVSLDPPLVLWSPAKASSRFHHFERAARFTVHVLAADQKPLCDAVLASKDALIEAGEVLRTGAAATFACDTHAVHDAGDHVIVVGRVIRVRHRAAVPLAFHAGSFVGLGDPVV